MKVDTDLQTVMALYDAQAAELCVVPVRNEALWRYQESAPPGIPEPPETYVVEDDTGVMGYFRVRKNMWEPGLEFMETSVRPGGHVWGSQHALLVVLRFAKELAKERKYAKLCFALPKSHPLVMVANDLGAESKRQYAWQVHIADHADFLRRIAPALERRLAHSLLTGFSGSLGINTMPRLIRLQFEQGRLLSVAQVDDSREKVVLRMPPLLLTQLVLGYRSCQEIIDCHLDARVHPRARQLVDILFPKTESFIYQAI